MVWCERLLRVENGPRSGSSLQKSVAPERPPFVLALAILIVVLSLEGGCEVMGDGIVLFEAMLDGLPNIAADRKWSLKVCNLPNRFLTPLTL